MFFEILSGEFHYELTSQTIQNLFDFVEIKKNLSSADFKFQALKYCYLPLIAIFKIVLRFVLSWNRNLFLIYLEFLSNIQENLEFEQIHNQLKSAIDENNRIVEERFKLLYPKIADNLNNELFSSGGSLNNNYSNYKKEMTKINILLESISSWIQSIETEQVQKNKINELLSAIGDTNEDYKELVKDLHISREEVEYSIVDKNHYYAGDLINILMHPFNQKDGRVKVYRAASSEGLKTYKSEIQSQKEEYAFIPLNVAYDKRDLTHLNHWVALVIDKKNGLMFYLDPAKKTYPTQEISDIKDTLKSTEGIQTVTKPIIINPIDFQQKEKEEGWIRHCGPYVIEIFKYFFKSIQEGQCISGSESPRSDVPNSITVLRALSAIPCGEAEAIETIRQDHIDTAHKIFVVHLPEIKNLQSDD